jgi:hypothetical protein
LQLFKLFLKKQIRFLSVYPYILFSRTMNRNHYVAVLFVSALLYILFTSSSGGRATAANSGNTGAPNETSTCVNCHNANTAYGTVTITIQVFQVGTTTPVTTYLPNTAYDMRVTVQNSAGSPVGYGFQMTALTTPGNLPLGGYSNLASNVKQKLMTSGTWNGRTYVEHSGVTANNQFNFRWTSPAAGTGAVRFYASGNAVNGNNGTSGDRSGVSSLTLQESLPITASASIQNTSCNDEQDGAINLTVTGGVPPYGFLWSNSSTSEDLTNVAAGLYSITITDAVNTTFNASYTIDEPSALSYTTTVSDPLTPFTTGTITFEAQGGTPPYQYFVNDVEIDSPTTEVTAGLLTTAIIDANGCTLTGSAIVTAPNEYSVQSNVNSVSCFGLTDGSISLSISGGTPPYTVTWQDGFIGSQRAQLAAGNYTLTISDIHDYSTTVLLQVTEPQPLVTDISVQNPLCHNQLATVTINPSGGTPPYSSSGPQLFPSGQQTIIVQDANGCSALTQVEIPNPLPLVAAATDAQVPCSGGSAEVIVSAEGGTLPYTGTGTFSVSTPGISNYTVTDANGCSVDVSATVSALDAFSISIQKQDAECNTSCSGEVQLNITNAIEPITITWNDGSQGAQRQNLCAGDYTASITDGSGCEALIELTIEEPSPLATTLNSSPILCFGDNSIVQATTTGGTSPYTFTFEGNTVSSTFEANAGNWVITTTDNNGCFVNTFFEITQPQSIFIDGEITAVDCFGENTGSIDLTVSGGNAPYTFEWNTNSFNPDLNNLTSGTYEVVVTDFFQCSESALFVVNESPELILDTLSFETLATGVGEAEVSATGGTPPYDYLWSNGQTGATATLAADGAYTVTVTDSNGCSVTANFSTPVSVSEIYEDKFIVFPNPAENNLNVHSVFEHDYVIDIYSSLGVHLHRFEATDRKISIDVSEWSIGLYFIVCSSSEGRVMHRIHKQ